MTKVYTADFETTTETTCVDETWVWSWGICEVGKPDTFHYGHEIEGFFDWAFTGPSKDVYFHNLKFDGQFILSWLLNNGYTHTDEKNSKQGTFQTVITDDGQYYKIEICYKARAKKKFKCTIMDSLKKLPFPVKRIAQAFNLPILKGEIDYDKVRPRGYRMDENEVDYLRNDVVIMALALQIQFEEDLTKMTIGSDSLNTFKEMITPKKFDRMYPQLELEVDDFIRASYKGGFTYVNPKWTEKEIGEGQVYDVNSLYPSVMYNYPTPYGEPIWFNGKYEYNPEYPLYIQSFSCDFEVKEGFIPTLQIKNDPEKRFNGREYLTSSNEHHPTLTLTSVDLKLFFDHYDVYESDLEWHGGYMFKSVEDVFRSYIDKFMEVKKRERGAKRELAKLLLNNLYGKFATSTHDQKKIPYLNEKGILKMEAGEEGVKKPIYTAVGAFITSYARDITIRSAQKLGDNFIYADTDSLHIRGTDVPDINIDPKELGAWKFEGNFVKARFLRAKSYIEEKCINAEGEECSIDEMVDTEIQVTCAGMPANVKKLVSFENFHFNTPPFPGKLTPKPVKGGVMLKPTEFSIKLSRSFR